MKPYQMVLVLIYTHVNFMTAQNNFQNLPYYEIPDYPSEYNQGTIVARMIDGLGFRFYWAIEGLCSEDLKFKPSEKARTTEETIEHILSLSQIIVNSALHKVNEGRTDYSTLSFKEKRKKPWKT